MQVVNFKNVVTLKSKLIKLKKIKFFQQYHLLKDLQNCKSVVWKYLKIGFEDEVRLQNCTMVNSNLGTLNPKMNPCVICIIYGQKYLKNTREFNKLGINWANSSVLISYNRAD